MTGTIANAVGILGGGIVGLFRKKPLSPSFESWLKVSVGALLVFYGLRLCWLSLSGTAWRILMQILSGILAMMLGRAIGHAMGLQKRSNAIGQMARGKLGPDGSGKGTRLSDGFKVSSALFCAAPLAMLGALQDGLSEYYYPLLIKAVIEALAAMGFAMLFGAGVLLAALPVFVFQGAITVICSRFVVPWLANHNGGAVIDHVNFVGGLLVFCVAMIILGIKKLEVADYLPSLLIAGLMGWFMK